VITMVNSEKNQDFSLIIDFDSTFVKTEALDELAAIALAGRADKPDILKRIKDTTEAGMVGRIDFRTSLETRLALLDANHQDIERLVVKLQADVSHSILRNRDFFVQNSGHIYIISGGFREYILPVVRDYGLPEEQVLANSFRFDKQGNITGFDPENPLSQPGGKVKQVKLLQPAGLIIMVGDGWTDYAVREQGLADRFVAFAENIYREPVAGQADKTAYDWEGFLAYFHNLF